jgi:hypothetical protein
MLVSAQISFMPDKSIAYVNCGTYVILAAWNMNNFVYALHQTRKRFSNHTTWPPMRQSKGQSHAMPLRQSGLKMWPVAAGLDMGNG